MTKISASFLFFIFFLLFFSVVPKQTRAYCELTTRGGGCPNLNDCIEVCRPCYRGIGRVYVSCRSAGGGIPFDECVCTFTNGAPCNPPPPPRCPKLWPPSQAADALFNGTTSHGTQHIVYLNQTHAFIEAFA